MSWYGVAYEVDLQAIRRRMVEIDSAAKDGQRRRPKGIKGWAKVMGLSHMSLYRLSNGNQVDLHTLNLVLEGLNLAFGEVCRPVERERQVA